MTKASHKFVYGKTTADIMISEGDAPSTYFLADEDLPTLWYDRMDDPRWEVLIPIGTILTLYTSSADGGAQPVFRPCTKTGKPVGVAQYHCFRPFDLGTSQAVGWIAKGYIKIPFVPSVLTPGDVADDTSPSGIQNDTISPGDYVMSDDLGRFTKWVGHDADHSYGYPTWSIVGQVIDIQKFGVTYDTQLMEYMEFPLTQMGADFQAKLNVLTEDEPYLHAADYHTMFTTGITPSPYTDFAGIDDALDQYGSQGMVTILLKL
jgi:hypothetical protein